MRDGKREKKTVDESELTVISYRHVGDSKFFVELLKGMYRTCRMRSQDGFEKGDSVAAYWAGRADSYEAILDNIEQSKSIKFQG